jgi:hypothetical protein
MATKEPFSSEKAQSDMVEFLESFDVPSECDESRAMLGYLTREIQDETPLSVLIKLMFPHYFEGRPTWTWMTSWYHMAQREMILRGHDDEFSTPS